MDKHQSWEWVTRHRLPLFLKSDLFSEYKLCKLLTRHTHSLDNSPKPRKSMSSTGLSAGKNGIGPLRKGSSNSAVCLPSLGLQVSPSSGSLLSTKPHSSVSASKSDIVLDGKRRRASSTSASQKETHHHQKVETLSEEVSCIVLEDISLDQPQTKSEGSSSKGYPKMSAEGMAAVVGTKSGMNALWKFLKGTMGERNWLFWLDAEHVKYHTKPIDQQR